LAMFPSHDPIGGALLAWIWPCLLPLQANLTKSILRIRQFLTIVGENMAKKAQYMAKKVQYLIKKAENMVKKVQYLVKKVENMAKKVQYLFKKAENMVKKAQYLAKKVENMAMKVEKWLMKLLIRKSQIAEIQHIGHFLLL